MNTPPSATDNRLYIWDAQEQTGRVVDGSEYERKPLIDVLAVRDQLSLWPQWDDPLIEETIHRTWDEVQTCPPPIQHQPLQIWTTAGSNTDEAPWARLDGTVITGLEVNTA